MPTPPTAPLSPSERRRRQGSFIVWAMPMLGVSFASASLVFDLGFLRTARVQMQNAADAAAHAAAQRLDGTPDGLTRAHNTANRLLHANPTTASTYLVGDQPDMVVRLGKWKNNAFVESTSVAEITAAQVDLERDDLQPMFSAIAWGHGDMPAVADATGLGGGPAGEGCALPIAVPDCGLPSGAAICNYDVTLNADNNDSGAWAQLGSSRPSASSVRTAFDSCVAADLGNTVTLNNGAINNASNSLTDAINASTETWKADEWGTEPAQMARSGVSPYGKVLHGRVFVFDDPANCTSTKYNGVSLPLSGFASAVVYDVATSGKVAERQVHLRIVCELSDAVGGGGYYGTTVQPSLVR